MSTIRFENLPAYCREAVPLFHIALAGNIFLSPEYKSNKDFVFDRFYKYRPWFRLGNGIAFDGIGCMQNYTRSICCLCAKNCFCFQQALLPVPPQWWTGQVRWCSPIFYDQSRRKDSIKKKEELLTRKTAIEAALKDVAKVLQKSTP